VNKANQIVIFGAGKIGRSFIGQIFSRGGYEVIFVEAVESLVNLLNKKRGYRVVFRDNTPEIIQVENVRAIHTSDRQSVIIEVSGVDLIAVCVGLNGLGDVAHLVAEALVTKWKNFPDRFTDVILAENLRHASEYFLLEMRKHLPDDFPISDKVGLIETSLGKMVPIISTEIFTEDPLQVHAEKYNTLILDGKGFKNTIPAIRDVSPKSNIKAWVDRKLFIHNLGHAMAAYFGNYHLPDREYMSEVLGDQKIEDLTRTAMRESGDILMAVHPGEFTKTDLEYHIQDLIERFKNHHLRDTVYRVGCDLKRKLGKDDRIAIPLSYAVHYNLPFATILQGYQCALTFNALDPDGKENKEDTQIRELYLNMGLTGVLEEISGLDPKAVLKN
jgi:mannitol-1-phosphate 5-dehydrogenase